MDNALNINFEFNDISIYTYNTAQIANVTKS